MKTFGFFMFLWLVVVLATFNIFKNGSDREILLFTLGTLLSYIFYKLIKEEAK
jgi:hypothetical protein